MGGILPALAATISVAIAVGQVLIYSMISSRRIRYSILIFLQCSISNPRVTTLNGVIEGFCLSNHPTHVNAFLSVPFAEPPARFTVSYQSDLPHSYRIHCRNQWPSLIGLVFSTRKLCPIDAFKQTQTSLKTACISTYSPPPLEQVYFQLIFRRDN